MTFSKILIAMDNSSVSLKAVQVGFALAKQLNATEALVFVVDKHKELGNTDLGIFPEQESIRLTKEAEAAIDQMISMYGAGLNVLKFTPEGSPEEEILNVAKEWGADLIVMGTHARTGLSHFFQGSLAEQIMHHAMVPVMMITPDMQ